MLRVNVGESLVRFNRYLTLERGAGGDRVDPILESRLCKGNE